MEVFDSEIVPVQDEAVFEMAGEQGNIGPELRFGHRALQMIHEACADDQAGVVTGNGVVECQEQRAFTVGIVEDQVRVKASELVDGLVECGDHRPFHGGFQAFPDESAATGAVLAQASGRRAADGAIFHDNQLRDLYAGDEMGVPIRRPRGYLAM
jgi:hypothetical protein